MKKILVLYLLSVFTTTGFGQSFETQINQITDSLSSKIIRSGKKRIAIMDFINLDHSQNQLGVFLCDEISADLAVKSQNQEKYRILERSNLDAIFEEKKLIKSIDGARNARELGRVDAADALITGVITDIDNHYHIVIKLLDSKTGDALNAYKLDLLKTSWLEKLYATETPENVNGHKAENSGATVSTRVDTVYVNKPSDNSAKSEILGDCSFAIGTDRGMCTSSARLTLSSKGIPGFEKVIDLTYGDTEHIYDLKSGIYQLKVVWSYSVLNVTGCKITQKEIRISPGKNETIILNM